MLPHALEQRRERRIPLDRIARTLEDPDLEYPGDRGRIVAEKRFGQERTVIKVVYNRGLEDERIVVTVMRGRPRR